MDEVRRCLAYSLVVKAGWHLLHMLEKSKPINIQEKGYLDFVSEADKEAERMIVSAIKLHFPGDGVLSEESQETAGKTGYRWIIDPLDGTHNYLAGLKEWGVLLAIEKEGNVIWGMAYFPALKETFIVEKGKGAFFNDKKIKVSDTNDFKGQMFCSDGIMRKKPREILGDIEKFCGIGCRLRVYGSSPYAFTRVAMGQALIATNRLGKPWDIAVPALLVEEAGGKVTDENGKPWSIDSESLIATNGLVHDRACMLFSFHGPQEILSYYLKSTEKNDKKISEEKER